MVSNLANDKKLSPAVPKHPQTASWAGCGPTKTPIKAFFWRMLPLFKNISLSHKFFTFLFNDPRSHLLKGLKENEKVEYQANKCFSCSSRLASKIFFEKGTWQNRTQHMTKSSACGAEASTYNLRCRSIHKRLRPTKTPLRVLLR